MKILFVSDIQAQGSDSSFREYRTSSHLSCVYRSLCWASEKATELKPDYIICLGDVAHVHSMIDIPANNAVMAGFSLLSKVGPPVIVISGNHDFDTREQKSSYVEALSHIDNIRVFTTPEEMELDGSRCVFLPYGSDTTQFDSPHYDYGFFHCGLEGFPIARGIFDKGLSKSFTDKFHQVFNGHYHDPCIYNRNVTIVGSLLYNDFNDDCLTDRTRGLLLFDTESGSTRIPNPFTPFYTTFSSRKALEDYTGDRAKTFARLVYEEKDEASLLGFAKVNQAYAPEVQVIQRSDINLESSPQDAVQEYAKLAKIGEDAVQYAIDILSSFKFTPKEIVPCNFDVMGCRVHAFMGILDAYTDYSKLGFCYVDGVNHDEVEAESSGSGKSSLFIEPIVWALWDRTIRDLPSDGVLNDVLQKDCYVYLRYKVSEVTYEIFRSRALSKTNFKLMNSEKVFEGSNVWLFRDGVDVTKYKQDETNKLIASTHGISWTAFVTFLVTGSVLQGDYLSFTKLGPSDRVSFLESFVSWLEVYPKAYEAVLADKRKRENTVEVSTQLIAACVKNLDVSRQELCSIGDSIDAFESGRTETLVEYVAQLGMAESEYSQLQLALQDHCVSLEVILDKKRNVPRKPDCNPFRDLLADYRASLREQRAIIANISVPFCPKCKQEVTAAFRKKVVDEAERLIHDISASELSTVESLRLAEEDSKDIELLIFQINEMERDALNRKSSIESQVRLKERDISTIQQQVASKKRETNPFTDSKDRLNSRVISMETDLRGQETLVLSEKKMLGFVAVWVKGFSPSGIRSYVLDKLLNQLNIHVASYCEGVFGGSVRVSFIPAIVRGKTSIDLDIRFGSKSRSYAACSGGEKRRVDVVASCSLRELVLSFYKITWNLAICDEATDALPQGPSERIVAVLRGYAPNVLILSHNPFIKTLVDNCVTVEKSGGVVSVKK